MRNHKVLIVVILLIALTLSFGLCFADMWEPYQFEPMDQYYDYRITSFENAQDENAEPKISKYELTIDQQDEGLEISVQTTWMAAEGELGSEILGGWWAAGAFGLTMAFINPMYAAFFGGLDLYEGNKMSFFGAGVVEVIGTEIVAGQSGFVCEFRTEDGGPVLGRYIVNASIPLPLKTELFEEDGTLQFRTELLNIEM
ncbi:hypothetical protein ACFL0G_01780 [Candidatus Zixiibacteriota bacterium]